MRTIRPARWRSRPFAAVPTLALVAAVAAVAQAAPASAAKPHDAAAFAPGDLLVATSVYTDNPNITAGVTQLPPGCGGSSFDPCVTAVAGGDYPDVFNNDAVDGSFGVTQPITLDELTPGGSLVKSQVLPNSGQPGVTASSDQLVTSFSSKSEMAMNLSTNGRSLTVMGYNAPSAAVDVSNSNTPGAVDPTSAVPGSYYREVGELGADGGLRLTETNAYSGNNGRAAILDNGTGLYYTAGNAGNGANPEPKGVVEGAGAQIITPASGPAAAQSPGAPTPVGSFNIAQLGNPADKSAKDDNFRGLGLFGNVLYFTKGSGGNGIDTVYFLDTTGKACPNGVGLPEPGAALPTASNFTYNTSDPALGLTAKNPGLTPENMCVLKGFPTVLAKTATDANDYPFGIWFANPHTAYVADEGAGDNKYDAVTNTYTAAAASTTAGLQKWVYDPSSGQWKLAYVLQSGLKLGVPYTVPGYPTGNNTGPGGSGLPWAPGTAGLRDLTGAVNPDGTVSLWAETSTVSGGGDQGADPNELVKISDDLGATSLPSGENFQTVLGPANRTVIRGVSLTPGTPVPTGNVTCAAGSYADTTIPGNLRVPAGGSCTLANVHVEGNVQVESGATLVDTGSTVDGNLQAKDAAGVAVQGGTINGNVQVDGTTGTPDEGVAVTANDLCGATVSGNVQVSNSGAGAPFDIGAAPDCGTPLSVGGNLQVSGNAGKMLIGPAGNGQGSTAQNNIQVSGNTGGGSLTDNTAGNNCQLGGDTPGITGSGNTAGNHNTCDATA